MNSRLNDRERRVNSREESLARIGITVLKEITTLVHTEFKLLRTEITEKLTATGVSVALIVVGAFLVLATLALLLQAAIVTFVVYGFSWLAAILMVGAITLIAGAGLLWTGIRGVGAERLAPSKTLNQLRKDASVAQGDEP